MKVKRAALIRHLERVMCRGQVTEAVFSDGFATQAFTADQLLLVLAPPLPKVEPLEEDIGVADLNVLVRSLGFIAGEGNEGADVSVRVENSRLVIDEDHRGVQYLMLASPRTIGTRIEQKTVDKLLAAAPELDEDKGVALTRALVEGIRATYAGYKAADIEVFVGPKGGCVRVGNETGHFAEFRSKDLKASEEYSVLFGQHLVDVLSQISDFSNAVLMLGGPGHLVSIFDGDYQYILGPRRRSTDDAASVKKARAAAKASTTTQDDDEDEKPAKKKAAAKKAARRASSEDDDE